MQGKGCGSRVDDDHAGAGGAGVLDIAAVSRYDWDGPMRRDDAAFWYGVVIGAVVEGMCVLLMAAALELLW